MLCPDWSKVGVERNDDSPLTAAALDFHSLWHEPSQQAAAVTAKGFRVRLSFG